MLWSLLLLACENPGHKAARVVPALERVNPSWGAEPVDCDIVHPSPSQKLGCAYKSLSCNDSIEGTTEGGPKKFGDDFYQQGQCTPQRNDYEDSPEAIYRLRVKPNTQVDLRLDSNCAELDVAAMSWPEDRCPTIKHTNQISRECEMNTSNDGGTLVLTTVKNTQTYLIVVDGKNGQKGNFRLDVQCRTYR